MQSNTRKTLLIVLTIILGLILIIGAVFYSSKNNKNEAIEIPPTWKTFPYQQPNGSSLPWGVSFKIPQEWNVGTYGPAEGDTLEEASEMPTTLLKNIHQAEFIIRPVTVAGKTAMVILPETSIRKKNWSLTSDQVVGGAMILKLPTPYINAFTEKESNFIFFALDGIIPKDSPDSPSLPLDTWKTIVASATLTPPQTVAEQLKPYEPFCKDVRPNGTAPTFAEFPVTEIFKGTPASLDLSEELARGYKTRFTEGLQKPADFAGHYVGVQWGCGSNCPLSAFVDLKTGKTYGVWGGVAYHVNSSLFVEGNDDSGNSEYVKQVWKYFKMTETGPEFICSELVSISATLDY